jgi:hypothetical protein
MNNDQFIQLLELLKTDIINSMQANGKGATGHTAKQITIVDNNGALQLELPGYMQLLETGRGPTGPNAVPGNPPMIQRFRQWCRAKGIPDKAAWAIKRSIDKKGFKGVAGILTEPLGNDNINQRLNPVLDNITNTLIKEIFKGL